MNQQKSSKIVNRHVMKALNSLSLGNHLEGFTPHQIYNQVKFQMRNLVTVRNMSEAINYALQKLTKMGLVYKQGNRFGMFSYQFANSLPKSEEFSKESNDTVSESGSEQHPTRKRTNRSVDSCSGDEYETKTKRKRSNDKPLTTKERAAPLRDKRYQRSCYRSLPYTRYPVFTPKEVSSSHSGQSETSQTPSLESPKSSDATSVEINKLANVATITDNFSNEGKVSESDTNSNTGSEKSAQKTPEKDSESEACSNTDSDLSVRKILVATDNISDPDISVSATNTDSELYIKNRAEPTDNDRKSGKTFGYWGFPSQESIENEPEERKSSTDSSDEDDNGSMKDDDFFFDF